MSRAGCFVKIAASSHSKGRDAGAESTASEVSFVQYTGYWRHWCYPTATLSPKIRHISSVDVFSWSVRVGASLPPVGFIAHHRDRLATTVEWSYVHGLQFATIPTRRGAAYMLRGDTTVRTGLGLSTV